jgi:L-glutamine-phosphate cytidylyltransferase
MVVDPQWRDETMKVIISEDRVIRMSKRIPQSEFSGTYIGITSFAADVQEGLFAKINNLIRAGNENEFFNVAVQQLADQGVPVGFTSTGDLPWAEIDDPGDLAFARLYVFPKLNSRPIAA